MNLCVRRVRKKSVGTENQINFCAQNFRFVDFVFVQKNVLYFKKINIKNWLSFQNVYSQMIDYCLHAIPLQIRDRDA
jgi:hypothetical protein